MDARLAYSKHRLVAAGHGRYRGRFQATPIVQPTRRQWFGGIAAAARLLGV